MRNIRNNEGFTLIELMIVVVIIGILAAIAIPRFTAVSDQAKAAEAQPILKQICTLAEAERLKSADNTYPAVALGALPGWSDPNAEYFEFTWGGANGIATATSAELGNQTLDCSRPDDVPAGG